MPHWLPNLVGWIVLSSMALMFFACWCVFTIRTSKHVYLFARYVHLKDEFKHSYGKLKQLWWWICIYSRIIWQEFEHAFLLGPRINYTKRIINGKVEIQKERQTL